MLNTISIRWKILVGLMTLAIIPMLLLTYLFTDRTNLLLTNQLDLTADQTGHFVIQSVAADEGKLLEKLGMMGADKELLNAIYSHQLSGDDSKLEPILKSYQLQHDFDRLEVRHLDGHNQTLETDDHLQNIKPEEDNAPELNNAKFSKLTVDRNRMAITAIIPIYLQNNLIANLSAYRYIDDNFTKQLNAMFKADLAFHDGNKVVTSSNPELFGIALEKILHADAVETVLHERSHLLYNYPLNHKVAGFLLGIDRSAISASGESMKMTLISIVAIVITIATLIGLLISGGIARPLNNVVNNLQRISEGDADLTYSLKVERHDEVGQLAESFNRFVTRMREIVLRTRNTSQTLSDASGSLRDRVSEVNQDARQQTIALEETHSNINDIGQTAGEIAENVSTLVASVQQSAAATHELESTTLSISEQMENLFGIISDISSSIHQLSSSNEQIDGNIIELSNKAKETSISAEQLEQATNAIEKSSDRNSQLAQQAASQALEGKAAVQDTIRGISGLQQLMEQSHLAIQELGERSDAIGSIVNVIDEVADQTNLLALNAAIIAAQAGEHGQGFAIVAEEMRNLAERTSVSTKEIAEIIDNLQQETLTAVNTIEAGSNRAHQEVARSHVAGEALEKLHRSSLISTEQITDIAQQTQKQSQENRNITQAVLGITKMLEQIAVSISQQTTSTRNLSSAASSMKTIAARVKNSTAEQGRGSKQIAQSMEHIQDMIELIDSATRSQNERSNDVVESVAMVRSIAEENANRAANMHLVVEELSKQAEDLHKEMGTFKT